MRDTAESLVIVAAGGTKLAKILTDYPQRVPHDRTFPARTGPFAAQRLRGLKEALLSCRVLSTSGKTRSRFREKIRIGGSAVGMLSVFHQSAYIRTIVSLWFTASLAVVRPDFLIGGFNPVFFAPGFLAAALGLGFMMTLLSATSGLFGSQAGCHGYSHKHSSSSMERICIVCVFDCTAMFLN